MQIFLNFVNFYRRFIHQFSKKTLSLSALLQEEKTEKFHTSFQITDSVAQTFNELKLAFITVFVLVHFDFELFIRVETNASDDAVADVLTQSHKNQKKQAH